MLLKWLFPDGEDMGKGCKISEVLLPTVSFSRAAHELLVYLISCRPRLPSLYSLSKHTYPRPRDEL